MRRALVTSLAVLLAVALAGCGGGNKRTIPTLKAESMLKQLDKIGSQFDAQACAGAHAKVVSLENQARALPRSVDREVKRNLEAGLARLDTLVQRDCHKPPSQTTTTTTPTVTVPTTTAPPPTTTAPPTTTTPPPTSTTPTTPGGGGGVTVPTTPGAGAQLGDGKGNGG